MTILSQSLRLLRSRGLSVEPRRNGVHLVIRTTDRVFDFWPTTGSWRERDNQLAPGSLAVHRTSLQSGNGIAGLLVAMGCESDGEAA